MVNRISVLKLSLIEGIMKTSLEIATTRPWRRILNIANLQALLSLPEVYVAAAVRSSHVS